LKSLKHWGSFCRKKKQKKRGEGVVGRSVVARPKRDAGLCLWKDQRKLRTLVKV